MEHQRPRRSVSTAEVGVANIGRNAGGIHPGVEAGLYPRWLMNYEERRPRELMELFGEFIGVFFYVAFGIGANMAFNITTLAREAGYGSLLNIAIAYGLGITFGIVVAGTTSGSHLSPGYTIAFAMFKGFPWRKVPQYIIAQILGAYCAALLVYAQYGQQARQVVAGLTAAGALATNFTPAGIAGALAIFPSPGQSLGLVFLNELVSTTLLAVLVFAVLDPTNLFVHFASGPWLIGFAYTGIILAFAVDTVTLNTARDLGGRFAAATIYGTSAIPSQFSALAALTNILGTQLGAFIQIMLLSDHRRQMVNHAPETHPAHPAYHGHTLVTSPETVNAGLPPTNGEYEKSHMSHHNGSIAGTHTAGNGALHNNASAV